MTILDRVKLKEQIIPILDGYIDAYEKQKASLVVDNGELVEFTDTEAEKGEAYFEIRCIEPKSSNEIQLNLKSVVNICKVFEFPCTMLDFDFVESNSKYEVFVVYKGYKFIALATESEYEEFKNEITCNKI